ncbi:HIT family protein [Pseudactinotalea sp. Z1739]|uniref:HIT family protein n=1 Tax=Pseudactinotalea sp. Z1739 TaxID=3413028 RepID=UPI003C7E40AB
MADACLFCAADVEEAPPRERAVRTGRWRLVVHRSALPGWFLLMPRRHIESVHELAPAEAADLGPLIQRASALHVQYFGAVKTYVMQFAEGVSHVHFSLVPRRIDFPEDRVGPASLGFNSKDEPLSDDQRDEIALKVERTWDLRPGSDQGL